MKATTPLMFVLGLLCVFQTVAQTCGTPNDISQNIADGDPPAGDHFAWFQPFVTDCNGAIDHISVWYQTGSNETATVFLMEGSNPAVGASNILTSFTHTFTAAGGPPDFEGERIDIPIPGNVNLSAGQTYAFALIFDQDALMSFSLGIDRFADGDLYWVERTGSATWIQAQTVSTPSQPVDLRFQVAFKNPAPYVMCREDRTFALGPDGTVNVTFGQMTAGSGASDGESLIIQSISQNTFDCDDIGTQSITLAVQDTSGQNAFCSTTITITDGEDPTLTCPDDIIFNTDPGVPAIVTYDSPTYSDCSPIGDFDDYTYIGTRDDKFYYVSNSYERADLAFAAAESLGGHVATIIDEDHNNFIRNAVNDIHGDESVLIGYNDASTEGTFVWHDGNTSISYDNWAPSQPNQSGNRDYALITGSGIWVSSNFTVRRPYILQLTGAPTTLLPATGLPSGSVFPLGTTTNTFEVTDAFGNIATCSFDVTVVENPFETLVELDSGKLTITDIENDSDDQITLSSDGTTLTISDLVVPTVSGSGVIKTDPTTVTVPMSNIINGIEFIGGNGNNRITIDSDISINGDFDIKNINTFNQNGAITLSGAFKVSESIALDLRIRRALTAQSMDLTGIDSLIDSSPGYPITITGTTNIQTAEITDLSFGATAPHVFGGLVNINASNFFLTSSQSIELGTIITTDTDDIRRNEIYVGSGDLTLTGDIITAGDSDLYLRGEGSVNQSSGIVVTDHLFLDGRDDGGTVAIFLGNNDIDMIQVEIGRTMELIVFNDIDDMEIGLLNIGDASLFAPTMNLTEYTNIVKNGAGTLTIGTDTSTINITNSTASSVASIEHNAGSVEFFGSTITVEKLNYQGASGTRTRFLDGNTTFNDLDLSLEFGTLAIQAPVNIGSSGINIEVLDELLIDRFNGVLSGAGTITGTSTTVELDGTIAPGNGTTPSILTIQSVEFDEGIFAPYIDTDSAFDQLNVVGTVTLTDADFAPTGDFSIDDASIGVITLINNDGADPVVGTFNGFAEGAQVTLPGSTEEFTISYVGGDGNDVTLTRERTLAPVISCPSDVTLECGTVIGLGVSSDTPIDIPDNDDTGITSIANVSGLDSHFQIVDIKVQTAINHTWTGDLAMELTAPGGETVVLFAESLVENSDLNADFPITFTDSGSTPAEDIGNEIGASQSACQADNKCEYTAMEGVDAFEQLINSIITNGNSFNGDWTLSLRDQTGADTGNLVSWQVTIIALNPNTTDPTNPTTTGMATATDTQGTPTITYNDVTISGACGYTGTTERTWTATDADGNVSTCVQTITVTDTTAPVVTSCPEDIVFEIEAGDPDPTITYDFPEATDNCGDVTIIQTEGIASGETFPQGVTTNTFSITDACGNESLCTFTVSVTIDETLVSIAGDILTIEDVNGGVSDDDFTLSDDGTTLTITNLTAPVEVTGGPVLVDDTTVTVDISLFTGGMLINTNGGTNAVAIATSSATAINIEGDNTATMELDAINTGDLNIVGFTEITDAGSAIAVTGVSTLEASGQIAINDGEGNHSFGGAINIDASRITFSAGANITFNEVTISATDPLQNFLIASPGTITLDGNVSIIDTNTNLFIASNDGIFQQSGIINKGFLILRGNGSGTAVLDQANTVGAISAQNPFNADQSAFTNLSFTNATDTFLADIIVDEFTLTAPQFDLEPNFTIITKNGAGESNFNADMDINNGTGTARFNHNAGTINFNGTTNDFNGRVTYNGAAGTTTNLNSDSTDFPVGGPGRSFTFGTLNGTGNISAGDVQINILDAANFSGNNTLLTGLPFVIGALATISNDATIRPGKGITGFEYTFDDLLMNTGATFAPRIVGDQVGPGSDFDSLTINGTITLDDANLEPTDGFLAQLAGEIIIINNDGADPVSGTFNGLPEGASISFGNYNGFISYVGGDGNDVSLTPDLSNIVPVLISEYQPITIDANVPQTVEFKGPADESFSGVFVIIDGDNSRNGRGVVTDVIDISGDFNADGILTVSVPNLTNPAHTAVLVNSFSGTVDVTDIDTDNDGVAEDLSTFGTIIYDAIGVGDGGACCPISVTYGTDFGGVNLPSIGSIPGAIFREGSIGDFFQISTSSSNIYDNTGATVDASLFDTTPTLSGTFGAINPSTIQEVIIRPKIYLQGAALNPNAGQTSWMRDDLRVANLLPIASPYGDLTADANAFSGVEPNNNIVDWVWVELRDGNDTADNATNIIAGRSALLQRDGDVVDVDGSTAVIFESVSSGDYYVVIKHRNHLGIMSNSPIALSSTATLVNFADGSVATYGTNAQTTFGMPTGIQGMWAGDANGDGKVNIIGAPNDTNTLRDKILDDPINLIIQFYGFTVSGYTNEDVNLSGGANIIGVNNDANVLRDDILNHPINSFLQFYGYNILEQLPAIVPEARKAFDIEMTERNRKKNN
ncbi:HYR domain-containing protein [Winogradskyella sp. 3972H.M.0a.05]|uniref:HYR domain-containing protein n=1 Tax=Winogradskyella sp. 3972H.M.0a.05 TaxID=2950277 RepID=UPI0033917372